MYICVTEVDAVTKIPCTVAPQRTGPSMPNIKGFKPDWADQSTWPVELNSFGVYLRAPKYYGICDDDADTNVAGVLEVLSENDYFARKQQEYQARKPYQSWLWNESDGQWEPPVPMPDDGEMYSWDEATTSWVVMEVQDGN